MYFCLGKFLLILSLKNDRGHSGGSLRTEDRMENLLKTSFPNYITSLSDVILTKCIILPFNPPKPPTSLQTYSASIKGHVFFQRP